MGKEKLFDKLLIGEKKDFVGGNAVRYFRLIASTEISERTDFRRCYLLRIIEDTFLFDFAVTTARISQ